VHVCVDRSYLQFSDYVDMPMLWCTNCDAKSVLDMPIDCFESSAISIGTESHTYNITMGVINVMNMTAILRHNITLSICCISKK